MFPISFDESNAFLNAPPGISLCDCSVLSIYSGEFPNGQPCVISCWKPTKEELAEINRTGRIWLLVMGETMPPVLLAGETPFGAPTEESTDDG